MTAASLAIKCHFRKLKDPRRRHGREHRFLDIIVIGICAVLSGANTWRDIACFGKRRQSWLKRFLTLPNGIPSHDTFERVFQRLDAKQFQTCLRGWLLALAGVVEIRHVSIDGKTMRRTQDAPRGLGPLHLVSAWASEHHLTLGEVAVDAKSNEITAIPQLLDTLDLHGALVTIDAMGCQKAIAEKIVARGGDYALVVKGNQDNLLTDIQHVVGQVLENSEQGQDYHTYEQVGRGHGRDEKRGCVVVTNLKNLEHQGEWEKLRVVGMIYRERTIGGKSSNEVSYFIGSKKAGARTYAHGLRNHWSIENNLHWQLDVSFDEDHNRTVHRNATINLASLRKTALTLLKRHPGDHSIRTKRLQAAWDTAFLEEILTALANSDKP
jgi:predicted transposase YbfD/YdcC